ncbi:MAG TPA: PAS domain S-box protein [Actinomycetota bacterium]
MTTLGPGPGTVLERRYAARPAAVADARGALDDLAEVLDPACVESLRLLVSELVTNAIRHGPTGDDAHVDLRVALAGDTVRVEVVDTGDGFRPPEGPRRDGAGGWGLVLVDRVAGRWGVAEGAPTRVWIEVDGARRREIPESPWPSSLDSVLLDRLRAAVIATDLEGIVTRWNRQAEVLLGYLSAEAMGRSVAEMLAADDDAADTIVQRIRTGEAWEGEWLAPRKDGSKVWIWVGSTPVHDESGQSIGLLAAAIDISERKRAQAALRESEERLRIAAGAGQMGTWDWHISDGSVRWSDSLEEIHGLRPGTFGGTFEAFQRDVHPEDREAVIAAIERAVNAGGDYGLDYRIVRPDGAVRWLTVRGEVFRDDKGRPARMAGVCADITERKEAERALEVQFAVSRALAQAASVEDAAPAVISAICQTLGWELGLFWRVDEAADALVCVGGWRTPTSAAGPFLASSSGYRFARGAGLMGRVWETGRTIWIPDVMRDEDFPRGPRVVEAGLHAAVAFPITLQGEVLGSVECFSTRIREPDEALLELMGSVGVQIGQFLERMDAEAQVAESEARKSAILAASLEAIITIDEHGTVVELNPAAGEMFRLAPEAVVGRELAEIVIPERYRERHRAALARFRETRRGRMLGRRMELSGLRSDGSEFPLELTLTRVEYPGSGPALFTGYLRDITHRRRVEELQTRLLENERTAREQLETAHERMTFLADASVTLASSLDHRKTLAKVARLSVPRLADWCTVDLVEQDGSIQSVVVAHVDPEKVSLAREYRRRYPPRPDDATGVAAVIREGKPELFPVVTDEMLERGSSDPEQRDVARTLGLRSAMTVPLVARGRALGAITFASAESGRTFGPDDLELAEDLAQRAALAIDNARLYEERSHVARTLQRTLLPRRLPDIPGVEVAAFYQPAGVLQTEVGGDFYDVFDAADGAWGLAIGDVCGKGVEAAALTGLARHTIRSTSMRERSPSVALADLNGVLLREDGDRFCTVALGRLEVHEAGARLSVSCGGHPLPLVLRRDGRVEAVGTPGSLLGVFEEANVEDRTAELAPGDTVVFFTDGIVDPRHVDPLDDEALRSLLGTCRDFDAQQTTDCLSDAIADPRGEAPDDVALLVLRVAP